MSRYLTLSAFAAAVTLTLAPASQAQPRHHRAPHTTEAPPAAAFYDRQVAPVPNAQAPAHGEFGSFSAASVAKTLGY